MGRYLSECPSSNLQPIIPKYLPPAVRHLPPSLFPPLIPSQHHQPPHIITTSHTHPTINQAHPSSLQVTPPQCFPPPYLPECMRDKSQQNHTLHSTHPTSQGLSSNSQTIPQVQPQSQAPTTWNTWTSQPQGTSPSMRTGTSTSVGFTAKIFIRAQRALPVTLSPADKTYQQFSRRLVRFSKLSLRDQVHYADLIESVKVLENSVKQYLSPGAVEMAEKFGESPARTSCGEMIDLLFLMTRMSALAWEEKVKDPILEIPFPEILDTFRTYRKARLAPVLHVASPANPM